MPDTLLVRALDRLDQIDPERWNLLNRQAGGSVLSSHAFLNAFEQSQSVCKTTGWQPQHLVVESTSNAEPDILAVMPLYIKGHSYGEFVFDWAWADAYQRHGLSYYPKWLSAIPFTPVTSSRLLCADEFKATGAHALMQAIKSADLSSLHILYTTKEDQQALENVGCLRRHHVQFHWVNRGWKNFDDFLSDLTQSKRKKIRAERRKVVTAGVTTCVKSGTDITSNDWDFFYRCYANTYAERGNHPYLTRAFFDLVPKHCCVLVLAHLDSQPIAASLLLLDQVFDPESNRTLTKLYGRYWGSVTHIDCLHFEVAYYSPIQWAIEHRVDIIEGGAQGEHKMARGFMPVQTTSAHWLAHDGFRDAVADFLKREQQGLAAYDETLRSPFKTK